MKTCRFVLALLLLAAPTWAGPGGKGGGPGGGSGGGGGGGGGGGHIIQDEAVDLPDQTRLNFTGAGISCANNIGQSRTDCTVAGAAGGPPSFDTITSGTNTAAAMHIGTGASLDATGSGSIVATTAGALTTNPPACGANLFVTDIAAAGTLTCTQPAFSNLTGSATDAQIPDSITITTAGTAAALSADPMDCSANQFATTIAASGDLTCAQPTFANLSGAATDAQVPNTITIDLATAATGLAADPMDCSANQFATTIAASGDLTCAQPTFANLSGAATDAQIPNTITIDLATAAGTATTAGAFTTDPMDCGVNAFALSIGANGDLGCAQPAFSNLSGSIADGQIPGTITRDSEVPSLDGVPLTNLTDLGDLCGNSGVFMRDNADSANICPSVPICVTGTEKLVWTGSVWSCVPDIGVGATPDVTIHAPHGQPAQAETDLIPADTCRCWCTGMPYSMSLGVRTEGYRVSTFDADDTAKLARYVFNTSSAGARQFLATLDVTTVGLRSNSTSDAVIAEAVGQFCDCVGADAPSGSPSFRLQAATEVEVQGIQFDIACTSGTPPATLTLPTPVPVVATRPPAIVLMSASTTTSSTTTSTSSTTSTT